MPVKLAKPPSALLFDLGGVLLDIDFNRVFNVWAQQDTVKAASIAEEFSTNESVRSAHIQHEIGQLSDESYFRNVQQELSLTLSIQEIHTGWNDIFLGEIHKVIDSKLMREPELSVY